MITDIYRHTTKKKYHYECVHYELEHNRFIHWK